jgi:hypothetical protein
MQHITHSQNNTQSCRKVLVPPQLFGSESEKFSQEFLAVFLKLVLEVLKVRHSRNKAYWNCLGRNCRPFLCAGMQ